MKRFAGYTLIGTLATVAIICILMVVLMKGPMMSGLTGTKAVKPRADGNGTTVLGGAKFAAEDVVCQSDLSQLRQSIDIYKMNNDGQPPARLEDTKIGQDMYRCPIGHEPYIYDPTTGQVHCPHPGHEKY